MKSTKELLRKQMELLAEQSKNATDSELARLSVAMCDVYERTACSKASLTISFVSLIVSILAIILKLSQ